MTELNIGVWRIVNERLDIFYGTGDGSGGSCHDLARDLNLNARTMTPADAEVLMGRVAEALSSFLGSESERLLRGMLKKVLRKHAPQYYEEKYGF